MPPFKETAKEKREREKFEARDDLRTLERADEVRADSSRVSRAQRAAREQLVAAEKTVRSVSAVRSGGGGKRKGRRASARRR